MTGTALAADGPEAGHTGSAPVRLMVDRAGCKIEYKIN